VVFSKRLTQEKKQSFVDVEEAYNLWDLLNSKYDLIDKMLIWHNYTHDKDFKILMGHVVDRTRKAAKSLETELKRYGLPAADKPRAGVKTSANSEVITDQELGKSILTMVQELLELILRAVRTATTNDNVRALFVKQVSGVIEDLNKLILYTKAKGWIAQPPMYPNVPADAGEKIDIGEAFHLWDHLTFRYDNIQQTQMWYEYAHDGEFKILLKKGLQETLKKQAEMLEQELLYFGIPLPKQPTEVIQTAKNTGIFNDDYMYRLLFIGVVGAMWIHSIAIKQCVTNDRLRRIFTDLLINEVRALDKIILYGKTKGWLNVVPQYNPQQ